MPRKVSFPKFDWLIFYISCGRLFSSTKAAYTHFKLKHAGKGGNNDKELVPIVNHDNDDSDAGKCLIFH